MLTKPSGEDLKDKALNRYELSIAISRRARQIINGSEKRINTDEKSAVTVAALELQEDKYNIERENEEE